MIKWNNLTVKFNNGTWKLFDISRFQDVEAFETAADLKWAIQHASGPHRLINEVDSILLSY